MSERTPAQVESEMVQMTNEYRDHYNFIIRSFPESQIEDAHNWIAAGKEHEQAVVQGHGDSPRYLHPAAHYLMQGEEKYLPPIKEHVKENLGAYQELAAADARMHRVTGLQLGYELVEEAETKKPPYLSLGDMLRAIPGKNGEACRSIYADHKDIIEAAPGSSKNHQAWIGGYYDHVVDAMNIAGTMFDSLNAARTLPFSKSDAYLVMFLHDLEKPFKYTVTENGELVDNPEFATKEARAAKRQELIDRYGIELSPQQANAMKYVESIRDQEYTNGVRLMGELASLCNAADTLSARLWYNHPLPAGEDEWTGARRLSPEAAKVVLKSEVHHVQASVEKTDIKIFAEGDVTHATSGDQPHQVNNRGWRVSDYEVDTNTDSEES